MYEHICRNRSLGLAPKARAYKVVGQEGSLGMKESVRDHSLTLLRKLLIWELEFRWILKSLENDC